MSSELENAKKILKVLNVPIGKLSLDKNQVVVQVCGTEKTVGFGAIILKAAKNNKSNLCYRSLHESVQIQQWLEYALTVLKNLNQSSLCKAILTELDKVFATRTFLINTRRTVCDLVLYYFLVNTLNNLNPQDKAHYLNVSRWFDNIQQDKAVRQDLPLVNFNTNYILSM